MVTASEKAQRRLDAALEALVNQDVSGRNDRRIESACDAVMDEVLTALGDVLGGNMARSKGIRLLVAKGAEAMLAERAERV